MVANDFYTHKPGQIVMYAVDWCPDCRRAKLFLKRHKISFLEINVDDDKQAASFVKDLNNGKRSVPTIIFPSGEILVEPSDGQLAEKFGV